MSPSVTLIDFLQQTGAHVRVFDMGRRVVKVPLELFRSFEQAAIPYPAPLTQSAWFGLLFWDERLADEHLIWFLKLPLDERGLLIQVARDEFLHRLLQAVGTRVQGLRGSGVENVLADSPWTFRPKEERLAAFHAKATKTLGLPASRFYEHAREYLAGAHGYNRWPLVSLQGLADVTARLSRDGNAALVAQAIPNLPAQAYAALCVCLENEAVDTAVARKVEARVHWALANDPGNAAEVASGIRAISFTKSGELRRRLLRDVLASSVGTEVEVLAAIGGRAWEALIDDELRPVYLERLAANKAGQEYFNHAMADLLYLPGIREHFFREFRDPARPEAVSRAIGRMFTTLSSGAP